ncbi:uncharacterized protein METZ01_LOCUS380566, partial [marine metagenome]
WGAKNFNKGKRIHQTKIRKIYSIGSKPFTLSIYYYVASSTYPRLVKAVGLMANLA